MKKYLFMFCILISTPVHAEDFITVLGIQCAKIMYNHSNWKYPDMYKNENSFNRQFTYLEKCLFLYKDNGGNIETLNKKYAQAINFEDIFYNRCLKNHINKSEDIAKERENCMEIKPLIWESVMSGKECQFYDITDIYYINDLLSHCKKD